MNELLEIRPQRRPHVTSVEMDGEALLYVADTGDMFRLDPMATALWNCFDGQTTLRELSEDLADVFPEDASAIAADLLRLTEELREMRLLHDR